MKQIIIITCFLIIGVITASSMVCAKRLSPIERALKALAEKNVLQADASINSMTGNAGMEAGSNTGSAVGTVVAGASNTKVAVIDAYLAANENQPKDPLGLTTTATAETIVVSWINSTNAWADFEGYQFTRVDLTGDHAKSVTTFVTPMAAYRDVSVQAKNYYEYQVIAIDIYGNSLLASNKIVAKLKASLPPEVPKDITSNSLPERTQIKWKKVTRTSHDIKGYLVYRKEKGSKEAACLNPEKPVDKEIFYDNTGVINQNYEYYITAIDNRGLTSTASNTVTATARMRDRNGLVLMSTAYRGFGRMDTGFNADIQFSYYIGTLFGEQDPTLSKLAVYLDPISVWLLGTDVKYTALTDETFPVAAAVGVKGGIQLFAGQQSSTSGSFTFSEKSELEYLWGGYAVLSKTLGQVGVHGGYLYGNYGDPVFFLSKYLEVEGTRHLVYMGVDFPIVRRMNAALEVLYPLNTDFESNQHPFLVNLHVDRLFNFDISYLHWDQGWAFLGYFNIRFTVFPGSPKQK